MNRSLKRKQYLKLPFFIILAAMILLKKFFIENGYERKIRIIIRLPYYIILDGLLFLRSKMESLTSSMSGKMDFYAQKLRQLKKSLGNVSLKKPNLSIRNLLSTVKEMFSQPITMKSIKRRGVPNLLILCMVATLITPMGLLNPVSAVSPIITEAPAFDVFISSNANLGFNTNDLEAKVKQNLTTMIGSAPVGDIRINASEYIDTTDLKNWYVYDHYDTAWYANQAAWQSATGFTSTVRRPYQAVTEGNGLKSDLATYTTLNSAAKLNQHILSGVDNTSKKPFMTFVGYGSSPNQFSDFIFYPTASSGTKTVMFDVDATGVQTHSLGSAGFLLNTKVNSDGILSGYMLLYTYLPSGSLSVPTSYGSIKLYQFKPNISAASFSASSSTGSYAEKIAAYATEVASVSLSSMPALFVNTSIKLTVTPNSLLVEHKQQGSASGYTEVADWTLSDTTTGNGFGPIVNYENYGHSCASVSYFKFSNLQMSFSDITSTSLLAPIQEADYLDNNSKKFFVNLVAEPYTTSSSATQMDLAYMSVMKDKKIALITNYTTAPNYVTDYLGVNTKNLNSLLTETTTGGIETYNISPVANGTDIDKLARDIAFYLYETQYDLNTGLPISNTTITVAKLLLKDLSTGTSIKVSKIGYEFLTSGGQKVYVDPSGSQNVGSLPPVYTIVKPGATATESLTLESDASGSYFIVTNNLTTWPIGEYTTTLSYGTNTIPSTARFSIVEDNTAPVVSATQNQGFVNATFTNTASPAGDTYTSALDYYKVIFSASSSKPSFATASAVTLTAGTTTASIAISGLSGGGYAHIILMDQAGNEGYASATITQVPPSITSLPVSSGIEYGQTLGDSTLTGGSATYNSQSVAGTFSWTTSTMKPPAGSNMKYSVTFTPSSAFYSTITTDVAITVGKVTPTITVTDKTSAYTGSPIPIGVATVSGASGMTAPSGSVTYRYYTDTSCTTLTTPGNSGASTNGGVPVIAGKYYVKASIAADSNYYPAITEAPGTLTILPQDIVGASLAITGIPQSITYGDAGFPISTTGGGGTGAISYTSSNPNIMAIASNGFLTINSAGSVTITAIKAADGNYNTSTTTAALVIAKKPVTFSFTDLTKQYTGNTQYASITPSDSNLRAGTDYSVSYTQGTVVTPVAQGSYTVTATMLNTNYTISGTSSATFTIMSASQLPLSIQNIPSNVVYGDAFTVGTIGGTEGGTVTYAITSGSSIASVNSATGAVTIKGVGSVTLQATKTSANYESQTAAATFVVSRKPISAAATAVNRTYDGTNSVAISGISLSGLLENDTVTATVSSAQMLNPDAGNDKVVRVNQITLTGAQSANYVLVSANLETTVDIAPITISAITITASDKVYDTTRNATITGVDSGSILTGDKGSVVIRGDGLFASAAASDTDQTVTFTSSGLTGSKASNYALQNGITATDSAKINKAKVLFNSSNDTYVYDGTQHPAVISATVEGTGDAFPSSNYKVYYNDFLDLPQNAGTYQVTVTIINSNYTGSLPETTITITSAEQVAFGINGIPNGQVQYKDTFNISTFGGNGTGAVSYNVSGTGIATVNTTGLVTVTGVGNLTIVATKAADTNYLEQTAQFTIQTYKKLVNLTALTTTSTYTGTEQDIDVLVDDSDVTFANLAATYVDLEDAENTQAKDVGQYQATVRVKTADPLFRSETVTGLLKISKANLNITADSKNKIYGEALPELTMSHSSLLGSDTNEALTWPTISCSASETSPVGTYAILLTGPVASKNYNVILQDGTLTVQKKVLTIIAGNLSKEYSMPNPAGQVTYSGFVNDQDASSLSGTLSYEFGNVVGGVLAETAGTSYVITASGLSSSNYDISFVNGTLAVNPLNIDVTAAGSTSRVTLTMTPAISGLTLGNITVTQGGNPVILSTIAEQLGGRSYVIGATLAVETQYSVSVDHGTNYQFAAAAFTVPVPRSGGGGGGGGGGFPTPTVTAPAITTSPAVVTLPVQPVQALEPAKSVGFVANSNMATLVNAKGEKTSQEMDVSPMIYQSRTFLPIKYVLEPLGGKAAWDQKEKKITVTEGTNQIELWIGINSAKVNGKTTRIDPGNPNIVPTVINGRALLPVRFISENLGYTVDWNQAEKMTTISKLDPLASTTLAVPPPTAIEIPKTTDQVLPTRSVTYSVGNTTTTVAEKDGKSVVKQLNTAPVLYLERTYIPVKEIVTMLGGTSSWNQTEKKMTIKANGKTMEAWLGSNTVKVNGTTIKIDANDPNVTPILSEIGTGMLPQQFLMKQLGYKVIWDQVNRTTTITIN